MRDLGDAGEPQGIAAQGKERAPAEFKFLIPYTQGPLPTPASAPKSLLKDHICLSQTLQGVSDESQGPRQGKKT